MRSLDRFDTIVLLSALAIAAFYRLYRLDQIPIGLWRDEAANGLDALRVLKGDRPIFFEANNGREPLFIYLQAASVGLFGRSPFSLRIVSAIIGTITVAVTYFMVRELMWSAGRSMGRVSALAAMWLALSYWHINLSRLGLRAILLPLVASLSFLFLWRGWNQMVVSDPRARGQSQRFLLWFVGSGALLGLTFYTYLASRLLPFVLLAFLGNLSTGGRASDAGKNSSPISRSSFSSLGTGFAALGLTAVLVAAPLGRYFVDHPEMFWRRPAQLLGPTGHAGEPLLIGFGKNLATQAAIFGIASDPNRMFNPAGRPAFEVFTTLCFIVGVLVSLRHWRVVPYRFALLWLCVMLFPAALTSEGLPHSLRGIGVLPVAYLFPALGVDRAWVWLHSHNTWRRLRYAFAGLVATSFVLMGVFTYRDYYNLAVEDYQLQLVFDARFVSMVAAMHDLDRAESVWIIPLAPNLAHEHGARDSDVIDFLYEGDEPRGYLLLLESKAPADLSVICGDSESAMVVTGKDYRLEKPWFDLYTDAKGLVSFLLAKYGNLAESHGYESFEISIYELPFETSFSIADVLEPANVRFGQELKLVAVAMGGSSQNPTSTPEEVNSPELPSGRNGWVVLRWRAESVPSQDYKVGVYLVDQRGRRVAQADKVLLSNDWQPTTLWTPDQEEIDYYILPSLPGAPPGWYDIEVAVYNEETMERLPVLNGMGRTVAQTATVGRLQVVTPLHPAVVQPAQTLAVAEASVAPDISLLGYDIPTTTLHPGDTLSVALYWRALRSVHGDYVMTMQLNDQHGRVWAEERGRPVYGTYPTTEWAPGEVLRDWHDLTIDPTIPDGSYQLGLQVKEATQVLGEISLGSVKVEGRAHLFDLPQIQHQLGVRLGEAVTLLGYDLSADHIEPGESLALTLYWQALTEMDISYTVFTHLLDREGRIWGQKDGVPGGGQLPTTSWVKGEIIEDQYEIEVSREAPAGVYVLEIGMYRWETGERLPVLDESGIPLTDRAPLGSVEIVGRN